MHALSFLRDTQVVTRIELSTFSILLASSLIACGSDQSTSLEDEWLDAGAPLDSGMSMDPDTPLVPSLPGEPDAGAPGGGLDDAGTPGGGLDAGAQIGSDLDAGLGDITDGGAADGGPDDAGTLPNDDLDAGMVSILELSASHRVVTAGDDVTLTWATREATSCQILPAGLAAAPAEFGTMQVSVDGPTTFTLSCEGLEGNAQRSVEVMVTDDDWAQVSAGGSHTCAIKSDGSLYCWGSGSSGKLGNDATDDSFVPVQEHTQASDWAQVSAGGSHTCAIKSDGSLYCWGSGSNGRLGTNSTDDSFVPVQEHTQASDWAQVAAGGSHTCAVKTDGTLYCWGNGYLGRLGNDATGDSWVPDQEDREEDDWAQVSAGFGHSCAVKTDGRLFCWGWGVAGQLGNDATDDSWVPVQEDGSDDDWAQVAVGQGHTCAVKTDGRLFCWGGGGSGQLGNNDVEDSHVPVQEHLEDPDWVQVSAGQAHTCATKTDGSLYCWGRGGSGQLGSGTADDSLIPVREHAQHDDWTQVATYSTHTCAIRSGGRLYCWGNGTNGRLGNDNHGGSLVPAQEHSRHDGWSQVSAGSSHSCAVQSGGTLWCWGLGHWGRLGNDSEDDSLVPAQEHLQDADWIQVSAAFAHSCAVKADGRLFCWGNDSSGRLGNGADGDSLVPVPEDSQASHWAQVSASDGHTCALTSDGRVFCWGRGGDGALGNGFTDNSHVPVPEATEASDWAQLSAGQNQTCAVKTDGRLFCWGDYEDEEEEGEGGEEAEPTGSLVPVQEATLATDWAQVAVGATHVCALKIDGRLFCWGEGTMGELGHGSYADSVAPVQEETLSNDWAQVSVGHNHTCALKSDGRLFCWGRGLEGQLGNHSTDNSSLPVQEHSHASNWAQVSASEFHTCAVKSDGRLFCWGSGGNGRLGIGAPLWPVWVTD